MLVEFRMVSYAAIHPLCCKEMDQKCWHPTSNRIAYPCQKKHLLGVSALTILTAHNKAMIATFQYNFDVGSIETITNSPIIKGSDDSIISACSMFPTDSN